MYCLLKLYRIDDLWWPWRSFKGHLMIRLRKSENKDNIFKIQICDVATRSILVIYMAGKYYTYTIISTNKISGIFKCIAVATAQTFKGIMEILQFFLIYLVVCIYNVSMALSFFFLFAADMDALNPLPMFYRCGECVKVKNPIWVPGWLLVDLTS